jgi:hypothetical protein
MDTPIDAELPSPTDDIAVLNDTAAGVGRRRDGPWRSAVAGAFIAALVTFIWSADVSAPGPEGLMGLEIWADLFYPALPRGIVLGLAVVWLANKLVSWTPNYWPPWDPASPPPATIDGHFGSAWLAGCAVPFVVAPVFGILPLAILSWSLHHKDVGAEVGHGAGVVTAVGASMLLVPRLARAAMREVDSRIYARRL